MRTILAIAVPLALLAAGPGAARPTDAPAAKTRAYGKKKLRKASHSSRRPASLLPAQQDEKQKQEAPAAAASSGGEALSGHIDIGARWVTRAGDFNTYRSLVNLSQGTRLSNAELKWEPSSSRLLDSASLQMLNWGGDPYNTARLDALKRGKYRYTGAYSNIAYFNALPSFANPGAGGTGLFLNQRTMDTRVRNYDNLLELFPGTRFTPYVGYSRNSSYGNGVTPLVLENNEYPLRNVIDWSQYEVRGGLRLEMARWHATVEEGGRRFEDNQNVFSTEPLPGNRLTPYLGQWLNLDSGNQLYRIRGEGEYTKGLLTASPAGWLDLSGSFIRSRPKTYSELNQSQTGSILSPDDPLVLLTGTTDYFFGNSTMPHVSASASAEARAGGRLRLRESWETDRFHTDGIGALRSVLLFAPASSTLTSLTAGERLEVTRNRQQVEALYDVLQSVTVRGGYRYEWGHSTMKASSYSVSGPQDRLELERRTGLAGFSVRPVQRLSLTGDFEFTDGVKTYYRTGLMDTNNVRLQGRLSLPAGFFLNANFNYFKNENPEAGIQYDYKAQAVAASLQWLPGSGKNASVVAEYQRSVIRSDINFLYPLGLFPVASNYRDYAHTGTLLVDLRLPFSKAYSGRLSFGGSFITTSGVRPTDYYEPQGRLLLPVTPKLQFFSEWRYYGLSETVYMFEGFRTHMYMGGVRLLL